MSTALVLLAAGLSRRMGQDKLLMKRHGKPLYRFSLELMGSFPDTSRLVVSNIGEIIDAAQALGFHTIGNPLAAQGMGTSVAAATACLREERAVSSMQTSPTSPRAVWRCSWPAPRRRTPLWCPGSRACPSPPAFSPGAFIRI